MGKNKNFEGQNQTNIDQESKSKEALRDVKVKKDVSTNKDLVEKQGFNDHQHSDFTSPKRDDLDKHLDEKEKEHEIKADPTVPDIHVNRAKENERINEPVSRKGFSPAEENTAKQEDVAAKQEIEKPDYEEKAREEKVKRQARYNEDHEKKEEKDDHMKKCEACHGEGLQDQKTLCPVCFGTGKVQK